jgi:hypothetical protein
MIKNCGRWNNFKEVFIITQARLSFKKMKATKMSYRVIENKGRYLSGR